MTVTRLDRGPARCAPPGAAPRYARRRPVGGRAGAGVGDRVAEGGESARAFVDRIYSIGVERHMIPDGSHGLIGLLVRPDRVDRTLTPAGML